MENFDILLKVTVVLLIALAITVFSFRMFNAHFTDDPREIWEEIWGELALLSTIFWGGATLFLAGLLSYLLIGGGAL